MPVSPVGASHLELLSYESHSAGFAVRERERVMLAEEKKRLSIHVLFVGRGVGILVWVAQLLPNPESFAFDRSSNRLLACPMRHADHDFAIPLHGDADGFSVRVNDFVI